MKSFFIFATIAISLTALAEPAAPKLDAKAVMYRVAPVLMSNRVAFGKGQMNDKGNFSCLMIVDREEIDLPMKLIINNEIVGELKIKNDLTPFYNEENNFEEMSASYNENNGTFAYNYGFGYMTNQYTGRNDYSLSIVKKSPNKFSLTYSHSWSDDDGWSGHNTYNCDLETKE